MQRTFLANLAFILSINLIIKPLYIFGVEVGVQNVLGADQYGLFFALLNTAYLLQILNDFGLQIFHNRLVARDHSQLGELIPGLSLLKLAFAGVYFLLLICLGYVLGYEGHLLVFVLIGLNLVMTSFILFLRSGISGLGLYRIDSALSVLDKFLMILIIGGMLIVLPKERFTLYHFILGQTLALGITLIIAFLLIGYYGTFTAVRIPIGRLRELARQALPYALVVFLMTLYTRSDGVMLKGLLPDGNYEAGVYAAGYRILDAINMVAFLYTVILLPMFSKILADKERLLRLLDESIRYMMMLVVPVSAFALIFHREIMSVLYIEAGMYWGRVFALLMVTLITTGVMYIFGTLLTAAGEVRKMNIIYGVTVALNVALNFLLIPKYKAAGAAISTIATQTFAAAGICLLCIRILRINLPSRLPLLFMAFAALCLLLYRGISEWIPLARWYISLPLLLLATAGIALLLRVIRVQELRSIFKR